MLDFRRTNSHSILLLLAASVIAIGSVSGCGGADKDDSPEAGEEDITGPGCEASGCGHLDSECVTGVCDAATRVCVTRASANATPCEDGDVCTTSDSCIAGVCVGGVQQDCSDFDSQCGVAACDPTLGCFGDPLVDGTACDDLNSCTADDHCVDGVCLGLSPALIGDNCAEAIEFPLGDGVFVAAGALDVCSTNAGESRAGGQCGAEAVGEGPDVIYSFVLEGGRNVSLETVDPLTGAPFDSILHLRRDACGHSAYEQACNDDADSHTYFSSLDVNLRASTYFVFVDAMSPGATGTFELVVEISSPEDCAVAGVIPIPNSSETTSVFGDTRGASNVFLAGWRAGDDCSGSTRPDHVYSFEIESRTSLSLELRSSGIHHLELFGGPGSTCGDHDPEDRLECDGEGRAEHTSRALIEREFEPGNYFAVIEGFPEEYGWTGAYSLVAELLPRFDFSEPVSTTLRGEQNLGATYTDVCPVGEVMNGVYGYVDPSDRSINQLRVGCREIVSRSTSRGVFRGVTQAQSALPARGTTSGDYMSSFCEQDEMVVGFSGRSGPESFDQLGVRCAPIAVEIDGAGAYFSTNQATSNRLPIGGTSGSAFPLTECPEDEVAIGATIVAGATVEAFALQCAQPGFF